MDEVFTVLRAIRSEQGLSQKDFATAIGMKAAAYNMIESGKNQPSYTLLKTVVDVFKLDANRLFTKNVDGDNKEIKNNYTGSNYTFNIKILTEAEFLNQAHEYVRKINDLYQRIIDVRVLLFQELRIRGAGATQSEADLLNKLARPSVTETNGENLFKYPYENLDGETKATYLQECEACVNLFSNTFFECFKQLYRGIVIPYNSEARKDFLLERAKLTDEWKYTWYIRRYNRDL